MGIAVNKKALLRTRERMLQQIYTVLCNKIAPWFQIKLYTYANVIIHPFSVHTRTFALTAISDLGIWWSLLPTVVKP